MSCFPSSLSHTHHPQVGMLEEDVLVGRSRKRRYSHAEMSQADLEATITGTQLACLMASGET